VIFDEEDEEEEEGYLLTRMRGLVIMFICFNKLLF
jgi:hypothetical protein